MDDNFFSNGQSGEEKQQRGHEPGLPSPSLPKPNGLGGTPPRPTVTNAPPIAPTGAPLAQPQSAPLRESANVTHDEEGFDVQNLSENEANDLYYKARNYFYLSFASMVPVVGVLIASFCWLKTKGWKKETEGWEIDDASEMVSLAAKMSKVWFVFSCINTFICLTNIDFPHSLLYMSGPPLLVGLLVLPQVFVLSVSVYRILDIELDRRRVLLTAVRAIAGSIAYQEVSLMVFHDVLFLMPVMLGFTSAAVYLIVGQYHVIPHYFRVILVALVSWLGLWLSFYLLSILWTYLL